MATNRHYAPLWWDREIDDRGKRIRDDVRQAACELWPICCCRVRTTLGDVAEATELMESAVAHVSRYLTNIEAPSFYPPAKSLLGTHFRQELGRLAGRLSRVQSVGLIADLEALVPDALVSSSWVEEADLWLDIGKLHNKVDDRSWIIFAMRHLRHEWPEVSEKLGIAISTAKNHFLNNFRRAWDELHNPAKAIRPGTNNNGKGSKQ